MKTTIFQGARQTGKTYNMINEFGQNYSGGKVLCIVTKKREEKRLERLIIDSLLKRKNKSEIAELCHTFYKQTRYETASEYLFNIRQHLTTKYEYIIIDESDFVLKEFFNTDNLLLTQDGANVKNLNSKDKDYSQELYAKGHEYE